MPRYFLTQAREERDLSQAELAKEMKVDKTTVSRWESGKIEPQPYQRRQIRDILKRDVDTYPHLFALNNQWSIKGIRDIMELMRRQFMELVAQIGGTSLFGNVSLALVSSPSIAPEEYLQQASVSIPWAWQALNHGYISDVERWIHTNVPSLVRLANTLAPYQSLAANLATKAKIMQLILATRNADFLAREAYAIEAVRYGELSGDQNLHMLALDWYGNTYTVCYHRSEQAIEIFEKMLPKLNSDISPVTKSAIYSNLSIAHAQKGDGTKAGDYIELAHTVMPTHPERDSMYQCAQWNHQVLDAQQTKVYLHLSEHVPHRYTQQINRILEQSTNLQSSDRNSLSYSLVIKADAARVLGEMNHLVDSLEPVLGMTVSYRRLIETQDVLDRVPKEWKGETAIKKLQENVSQAIVVARR